jgi:hypothetical protein
LERSRDLILMYKGDSIPVIIHSDMVLRGWPAGQGVEWVSTTGDRRVVTYSTGRYGGFLWMGSEEEELTSFSRSQPAYRWATMFTGGCILETTTYEKYTYASRQSGPLVPLVYSSNAPLYFSLRGWFTCEDEMTLTSDSRGPARSFAVVSSTPRSVNQYYLGVQTFY